MIGRVILDGLPLQVRSAGIAVYTAGLVRAMARQRPEMEFVLFGTAQPILAVLRQPASHALAGPWPANVRWARSSVYPLVMGYPLPALPRLLAVERTLPSATLFHGTNYALPRARSVPLVVTVHDLALLRFPELGTPALRRMVGRAQCSVAESRLVIAHSQATRRDLQTLLSVPEARIRVVPIGCDERFQPLPAERAREHVVERYGLDSAYILHVGTVEPRKNLAALIRVYAQQRAAGRLSHALVLTGSPGWKQDPLFRLVDTLGVRQHVHFTGPVPPDDLPFLYAAADLFVYPSLYEGFGLPPLEAMACGVPVVTSNVSSLPEVVGDAAILIDPRDDNALGEAIVLALADTALRRDLHARGLARARTFSWERCARETLAVYDEVC